MIATRQLSRHEAELLVDGFKKMYGVEPDSGKLSVVEGKKAESIFESMALTKRGEGGRTTYSYPSGGDFVSGAIVAEDKNTIYVDTKPCELRLYSIRRSWRRVA
jgi:hypothetical protein